MTFALTKDPSPEPLLSLAVRQTGSTTVVKLSGDLDIATVELFTESVRRVLDERGADGPLVLDLAELRFIGVAGIAALTWTRDSVGELVLVNPSDVVHKVFAIANVAGTFNLQAPTLLPGSSERG